MKKIFSIVFTVIAMFAFLITPALAQEEEEIPKLPIREGWQDMDDASDVVNDTPNGGQNADKLAGKSMYGTANVLLTAIAPELMPDSENIPNEAMRRGVLGTVDDGIVALFNNQPRVDVVAHLAEEWVPGYKDSNAVYANGYSDLKESGVSGLWSVTRNIAYAFYVVIMIIIGFMIMFRNKIGGQVMVTVGNSIPKIIISLVLVTFSFAIIGIIIDAAGVARNIIEAIFYANDASKSIDITNPWKLFGGIFSNSVGTTVIGGVGGGLGLAGTVGMLLGGVSGGWLLAGIALMVVALILSGIILVGAVKLWITLIKSYLGLLVNVITAPLTIMMSAIPGNDATMWNTFKSALRNALVFPVAYGIVNLPYFLEGEGLSLTFPGTLTGDVDMDAKTGMANILIGVARIVAIYAASSAPEIVKGIIPATAPKSGIDIGKSLSESVSKVPFIGGMLKG